MVACGYRRVSKRRPCCICGKPDWCSTTATETISFCARSTVNADRISPHGWGVFYNYNSGLDFNRAFYRIPKRKKVDVSSLLASPAMRDRVYRKLIELSPAPLNEEIVYGRGGLAERGISDYRQYGTLPKNAFGRDILVERLVETLAKESRADPLSFSGIPGFWRDVNGSLRLWSNNDSIDNLMLIPFVGPDGLIRACQIRFMRYVRNKSGRYVWLSSSKEQTGCGPGAPLHHASPAASSNKPILVTEGALKAATTQRFLSDRYVVGNSGVATSHREIVKTARRRPLEIAFDNDSFSNPHVARALAALVRLRHSDQDCFAYNEDVRVVTWDRHIKGVDEALLAGVRLEYLTVREWLKRLPPECLEQVTHSYCRLGGKEAAGKLTSWVRLTYSRARVSM